MSEIRMKARNLLIGFILIMLVVPTRTSHAEIFFNARAVSEETNTRISSLISHFSQNGYNIEQLLADSRFRIYEHIPGLFTNSAESEARRGLRNASSEEEKGEIFLEELTKYKEKINLSLKEQRINEFIQEYLEPLSSAEGEYDIHKGIIAAILGIESDFGRNSGRYNPFNVYVSLYSAGYRESFAVSQLEELLAFCNRNDLDVFSLRSSYAGAIGYCQFIPSSLNRWFVGKNIYDMQDNINSVANYLAYFKRRTGSLRTSIFRYNPDDFYVASVMDLAQAAGFKEEI